MNIYGEAQSELIWWNLPHSSTQLTIAKDLLSPELVHELVPSVHVKMCRLA